MSLYTPRSRHNHPQRGSQRPIPELNPLRSGRGDRKTTPVPAAAEKINSPDPDRAASSSSQPPAPDREQRTGVWEKKKKKKDPCFTPPASNVVLVCVVLRCFKTGVLLKQGRGTLHKLVSARPLPRALNVYVQLKIEKWALAPEGRLNEQTALRMPFSVPTPKAPICMCHVTVSNENV